MKVYKRGIFALLLSLVSISVFAVIVFFIASLFLSVIWYCAAIAAVLWIIGLFIVLRSENVRFELEDRRLRYYVANQLKKEFHIAEDSNISYKSVQKSGSDTQIDLYIDGEYVDASPIGLMKFQALYAELEDLVDSKPIKLTTGGKR